MLLVGSIAPDFIAKYIDSNNNISTINFHDYINGKMCVLFFYPLDFTFVCPSELIDFDRIMPQFNDIDTCILAVSVDSEFAHMTYRNVRMKDGGIYGTKLPIVSDLTKKISRDYGVLLEEQGISYRATFIIDKSKIIRHQSVNDFPIGRNVNEFLRITQAIIHHEKYGDVCPAGWNVNKPSMKPTQEGLKDYLAAMEMHLSDG